MQFFKIQMRNEKGEGKNVNFYPLPEFGCYVGVFENTLFDCPMMIGGLPDITDEDEFNIGEVTHPESQAFLDAVNIKFDTTFSMAQF